MSQPDNKLYEFGVFRLDAGQRLLWHGEEMLTWVILSSAARLASRRTFCTGSVRVLMSDGSV